MIANITGTIADGGLGAARSLERPPAVVGCSSSGTTDTPTLINSVEDAVSAFGYGKLVELIALYLAIAGGPVVAVKATTATAGSASSVTAAGSSTAVMTVSTSTSRDDYLVKIKVTRAGADLAAATACVRVSYDNGVTYGEEVAVPTSGILTLTNTGLAVTWADGTFVVGDTFAFKGTAPIWDTSGLGTALDSLEITALDHEFVHVAEHVTGATVGTLDTSVSTLESSSVYRWWLGTARDQSTGESVSTWSGVLIGGSPGFSAFTSRHGIVYAGVDLVPAYAVSGQLRRQVGWLVGPRLARLREVSGGAGLAEHPGRVRSGAVVGGVDGALVHDIRVLSTLDSHRFAGLQTLQGRSGYYATARTAAADGSDYTSIMNVRVVKEAARVATIAAGEFLSDNVRTITGGKIDPRDADAIDAYVTAQMVTAMVNTGYASSASAQVNRTDNLVSTQDLRFTVRVRPLGYAGTIELNIGLTSE